MSKKSKLAEHGIKKLDDYKHLRLKTEMYYGSRNPHTQDIVTFDNGNLVIRQTIWVPALYTAFREIVDNALDEIIGYGFGSKLDVTYDEKSRVMSVADDGRGIPIDWDDEHQCHIATLVLSEARAGRNFGERGETVGTNGIGASGVNFVSEYFILDIHREGTHFVQKFSEGEADNLVIGKPVIKKVKSDKTGTKITFKLSDKVFPHLALPNDFIKTRITEIAILNPNIRVTYNGEHIRVKPKVEQSLFPGKKPIVIDIDEQDIKSKFLILPSESDPEHIHSVVNNIPMFNGGIHIDIFRRTFYGNLLIALSRESKKRKLVPNRSDVQDGLFIYNATTMKAPNFDSQSKTRLINEEIATVVKKSLDNDQLYRDLIKKYPDWINGIYERCAKRTMKKDAADLSKLNKAAKKQKVEKLNDAIGRDRKKCILFLAEGDSAVSGLTEARNPELHGALPLQGKVLNCHPTKSTLKDIAANEALLQITRSIGLMIGERANRHSLRYGKVFITCDADEDGYNISALLVNFFYQLWPELFDPNDPFIYVFDTPLIIATKGKQKMYWYNDNYNEFDSEKYRSWEVQRAKGLASLRKPDWHHVLGDPKVMPIVNDGELEETLDLLFNENRSDDRKEWMGI
jgi:DNA gyrase/topoisomerase IV subunit B